MKYRLQKWMTALCSLALAFGSYAHWDGISVFLFGETAYPENPDM